jgi:lysophospholipase L1-like esterase
MVDAGFAQRLQKLVEARGGKLVHDAWTSSSTTSWSKGERLDNLLVVHRPDVVIVALGANEVFLPAPEAVAPRVRSIVQKLAPRPCVWVSPPLWKGETGIVSVERANAAPCGFYDSGSVQVERAKDGIHPTPKGGSDWAEAVFAAIVE